MGSADVSGFLSGRHAILAASQPGSVELVCFSKDGLTVVYTFQIRRQFSGKFAILSRKGIEFRHGAEPGNPLV